MSPRRLYRSLALAEMASWTLLLCAMALKYGAGVTAATPFAGGIHGFVFLSYVAATIAVWVDGRWSAAAGVAGLGSAIIPYCTYPFELWADRRGLLAHRWRIAGAEPPRTVPEQVLASALHRPVAAVVVSLAVVSAAFALLLGAGPPSQWGR